MKYVNEPQSRDVSAGGGVLLDTSSHAPESKSPDGLVRERPEER
jgi:hypothetical protein